MEHGTDDDPATGADWGSQWWVSILIFVGLVIVCALLEMFMKKLCAYSLSSVNDNYIFCYPIILATNICTVFLLLVVPINTFEWLSPLPFLLLPSSPLLPISPKSTFSQPAEAPASRARSPAPTRTQMNPKKHARSHKKQQKTLTKGIRCSFSFG